METSKNPNPGLYIDLDNPAPCSGQITQWNLCYYDPTPLHSENTVVIGLQVWRFDQLRQNGNLMGENVEEVLIPPNPTSFKCLLIAVDRERMVNVSAGDFLGVTLRQNSVLPVVANAPPGSEGIGGRQPSLLFLQPSIFTIEQVDLSSQDSDHTILSNNVMHLTADIGKCIVMLKINTLYIQS